MTDIEGQNVGVWKNNWIQAFIHICIAQIQNLVFK